MAIEEDVRGELRKRREVKSVVAGVVDEYYSKRESLGENEEELKEKLISIKKESVPHT